MASARKRSPKAARKSPAGTSEANRAVVEERVARAKMPREGDPGVLPQGAQRSGPEIETVEANLNSTYEWGGRLYGPGDRILVPKGLADLVKVKLPKSVEGWNPASRQIEDRSDAAHPALGYQGAGAKEGRQK